MDSTEPDLGAAFNCAVPIYDRDDELQVQAVLDAVTSHNQAGGCNARFVRPDALLVVVMLTDEDDGVTSFDGQSPGTPAEWKQKLVQAKGGNEESIVMLGLLGDFHIADPVCACPAGSPRVQCPPDAPTDGDTGHSSPTLSAFFESFEYGSWASVCEPDYRPFFTESVSVIDTACRRFRPAR